MEIKNRLDHMTNLEKILLVTLVKGFSLEGLAQRMQVSKDDVIDLHLQNNICDTVFSELCMVLDVPEDIVRGLNSTNVATFFKKYHSSSINDKDINDAFEDSYKLPFNPFERIIELYIRLFFSEREKFSLLMEAVKNE